MLPNIAALSNLPRVSISNLAIEAKEENRLAPTCLSPETNKTVAVELYKFLPGQMMVTIWRWELLVYVR